MTNTSPDISSPEVDKLIRHVCEFQQRHPEDFKTEVKRVRDRLKKAKSFLLGQKPSILAGFENYWLMEVSPSSRTVLISNVCKYIINSIATTENPLFQCEELLDEQLFSSLCRDFNLIDFTTSETVCIRNDDLIMTDHCNALKVRYNNETVEALCLFKQFITYFVINGLVVMYNSIKTAKLDD